MVWDVVGEEGVGRDGVGNTEKALEDWIEHDVRRGDMIFDRVGRTGIELSLTGFDGMPLVENMDATTMSTQQYWNPFFHTLSSKKYDSAGQVSESRQ